LNEQIFARKKIHKIFQVRKLINKLKKVRKIEKKLNTTAARKKDEEDDSGCDSEGFSWKGERDMQDHKNEEEAKKCEVDDKCRWGKYSEIQNN
jgi:hypothetical protein